MTTSEKFLWGTVIAFIAAMLTWPFVVALGLAGLGLYPLAWLFAAFVIVRYIRGY